MSGRLASRKFWVAIGTIVAVLLIDIAGMDIDRETVITVVGTVAAYLLGQSWVDAHNGGGPPKP